MEVFGLCSPRCIERRFFFSLQLLIEDTWVALGMEEDVQCPGCLGLKTRSMDASRHAVKVDMSMLGSRLDFLKVSTFH